MPKQKIALLCGCLLMCTFSCHQPSQQPVSAAANSQLAQPDVTVTGSNDSIDW